MGVGSWNSGRRWLEGHADAELQLASRIGLCELAEGRGRLLGICARSKHVLNVRVVGAVEDIEDVEQGFDLEASDPERRRETDVDRRLNGEPSGVSSQARGGRGRIGAGAIRREAAAVTIPIEIRTRKNVLRPPRSDVRQC